MLANARSAALSKRSHYRRTRRDPVAVRASVFCPLFDAPVDVETSDLSPAGMFLVSDLLLHPGDRVLVAFAVPGTVHQLMADAEVVRVNSESGEAGMGLAFKRLPNIDEKILRKALDHRFEQTLALAPSPDESSFGC